MLGTGLIGLFYTRTLHGQRNRDRVHVVYSRSEERAKSFCADNDVPAWTTDLEEAIAHPETDTVVIGLPNQLHEEAVELCARHGKAVLCTKPLARTAEEAKRMLDTVEQRRRLRRLPRGSRLHAQDPESGRRGSGGPDRGRALGALARDAPRSAQRLVLGRGAGRRWADRRSRLPLHRDHPLLHGQGEPARGGDVLDATRSSIRSRPRTTRSR